jgi:hypothetical protein
MRESRTYGSVRGARGNSRPYRDLQFAALHMSALVQILWGERRGHGTFGAVSLRWLEINT